MVRTFTRSRSMTVVAASRASGKNCSARQVGNSTTSFMVRPDYRAEKHFGTMHTHHDAFLDIGGAARPGYERHAIGSDGIGAECRDGGREIGHHPIDIHDDDADR